MQAKDVIEWRGKNVLVFVGDSPLIKARTIRKLLDHHIKTKADCTFLTSDFKMDLPYGRVVRDAKGNLLKCVEEKNANEEELKIRELLSSHFVFKGDSLFKFIHDLKPDPDNNEYYLTEILEIFIKNGLQVETLIIDNYEELVGLNSPEDLAWAEKILLKKD
jgi:bifunctional N-acetylglucosamine-1-phosphate-uridyltransferase/glucosamine-1-phosphate-acetyltransferase GlmU-like protein